MPSTTCGWCGRFSNMTRLTNAVEIADRSWPDRATIMGVFTCDYCRRQSIAWTNAESSPFGSANDWLDQMDDYLHWIPQTGIGKKFEDVPPHIADAASEAHSCQSINAHRAAVLLARAVIEATAKDKGITTGNLCTKIDKLCDEQFIRPNIRDEAHEIRHLGNDMAHGDFVEPVTVEDADSVLILMGEVLNEVFQGPAVAQRLRQRRLGAQS